VGATQQALAAFEAVQPTPRCCIGVHWHTNTA
jgi:hypothetical protein